MTDMKTTKITLATVKSFIKKNAGNLFIKVISDFDGMTDGLEFKKGAQFEKAEPETRLVEETLGIKGAWFVGQSRDYFKAYEDDRFIGFHVWNSCGSFDIAIEKSPSPVETPEEEDVDTKKLASVVLVVAVAEHSEKIKVNASLSAKYNIMWYGNTGFCIHSEGGRLLKVFAEKEEQENYHDAVIWGTKNLDQIRDKKTPSRGRAK